VKRKIIQIDRDLCDGCELCTTACAEGALALDGENKAVLVKEIYCDGLGACLNVCPTGALKIVEREGPGYDAGAAYEHVLKTRCREAAGHVHGIAETEACTPASAAAGRSRVPLMEGCPGSAACEIPGESGGGGRDGETAVGSELRQWPIQLHLISPYAPYFKESDLLIAADCTAFALGSFHPGILRGKKLVIACPKLDETEGYVEKLAELIKTNNLRSLTVAVMTVPCCSGLYRMVEEAVRQSGVKIALNRKVVHINGQLVA
jgi:NAD-dependent dihydropyrimidine dehydrogenase PreA subunit